MVHSKEYIDATLFRSLNHEVLAQHVIPDTFEGAGENAYAARKDCAEKVVEYFKRNLSLNVKLASKNWKTKHFCMMVGRKVFTKPVAVARCNLATSSHCILYCQDCCESEEKKCSPIAKVLFSHDSCAVDATLKVGVAMEELADKRMIHVGEHVQIGTLGDHSKRHACLFGAAPMIPVDRLAVRKNAAGNAFRRFG